MPEGEFSETPQPTEPKAANWPKIILAAVLGLFLLLGAAYAGYWYGTESVKLPPEADQPRADNSQITETPTPEATPTPTAVVENETIAYDLTLEPTEDWVTKSICGVSFEVNPKFKDILKDQPQEIENTCLFGYNYKDLIPGQIIPVIFNVYVYKGYDGSSKRQFYFSKRFPGKPIEDLEAFHYAWSRGFKAGKNNGLLLEFEDADLGDSIAGFRTYLVVVDETTLVAVESSLESEILKMFLTGIWT